MTDYFARDDVLEPALAVICEVLRDIDDIGGLMDKKAASFLSLAQPYEKERSAEDHDLTSHKKVIKTVNQKRSCFNFQKGSCYFKDCHYKHECKECDSGSHCARRRQMSRKTPQVQKTKKI